MDTSRYIGIREAILIVFLPIVLASLSSGCASGLGPFVSGDDKTKEPVIDRGGRSVIESIDFVNNRTYKDESLRKKLDFKVGDYLDPVLAEAYRTTLTEFYRKKGFTFVQVRLDSEKLQKGQVIYAIDEGPRIKMESVEFVGNNAIKTSTLKKVIKTGTKRWLVLPKYYVEEEPTEDVARLQNIYYERGFLDYKIAVRREFTDGQTKAHITFEIEEGQAYTVEKIVFIDNRHFDEETLLAGLKLKEGQVYSGRRADSHAERILELYSEQGFIDARVEQKPQFVAVRGLVNVQFSIDEGNQFRIGRIDIIGNEQTQDKVVRRVLDEYDFAPGQLYNADLAPKQGGGKLEEYVQRMALAGEVIISPVVASSGALDQKDVKVDIKEGQTGSIMLGGGVSSDSDVIGQLVFQQRNFDITDWPESFGEFITGDAFKGAGQSLRIAAEPGIEVSQYSITFTEPYFRDKPVSLDVIGSSWERYRESYDEQRTKGYVGIEKRYKSRWRNSIGVRVENVRVGALYTDAPQEIINVKGGNALVGVKIGVGRDLTNDRFNPSEGYTFNADYEQIAGDGTFGIARGTHIWYKTLYEDLLERKTVLATKVLSATTISEAPPFEKFYAGGTGTYGIRGFEYRGVSTRGLQTGVPSPKRLAPIGSDWIFLANAEVTVPLVSDNLAVLFFVDSGTIDTGGYRASVGTGIQILIPQWFGPVPMRLGVAAPFLKDDGDNTEAFFFSMAGFF
ncbi:MAG: outer membrane protein assembly factor BamA [Planctomycetota bacterium]|jgi:outer membrane protein insertion porin family